VAKGKELYDVWFLAADQVYRGVPWNVVSGWAEQGRLAGSDRVRRSGTETAWVKVSEEPRIADFLFQPTKHRHETAETIGPIELDLDEPRRGAEAEDDEVDMIPLIDISLVLLVFFMMTTVVSSMSPVDVPSMNYAQELAKESNAITIHIDKLSGSKEHVFAVRIGEAGAKPMDNNLLTLGELLARLDANLAEMREPPEVRVACHKDLPRDLVRVVTVELDKRQRKKLIRQYSADVNEAKK
jgi:biopolymer transport protein ExbD